MIFIFFLIVPLFLVQCLLSGYDFDTILNPYEIMQVLFGTFFCGSSAIAGFGPCTPDFTEPSTENHPEAMLGELGKAGGELGNGFAAYCWLRTEKQFGQPRTAPQRA